jgi:hypothetical protein
MRCMGSRASIMWAFRPLAVMRVSDLMTWLEQAGWGIGISQVMVRSAVFSSLNPAQLTVQVFFYPFDGILAYDE